MYIVRREDRLLHADCRCRPIAKERILKGPEINFDSFDLKGLIEIFLQIFGFWRFLAIGNYFDVVKMNIFSKSYNLRDC